MRHFPDHFLATDGISGGPGKAWTRQAPPSSPVDAEQARLAGGAGKLVTKDAFVKDRLARELPKGASQAEQAAMQARFEAEYLSHDPNHNGLDQGEFRQLMEDRAAHGWDTSLGGATVTSQTAPQTGITQRGQAVSAEQTAANTWLTTDAGKAWAQSEAGQAAVGSSGQLKVDGLEGPRTRATTQAMHEAQTSHTDTPHQLSQAESIVHGFEVQAGLPADHPAKAAYAAAIQGRVQRLLDDHQPGAARELMSQLALHHLRPEAVIPDHTQRATLLMQLDGPHASPLQKTALATSLVRDDLVAGHAIDPQLAWRTAMNDQPSAGTLANALSRRELAGLRAQQPEYFQALDMRSGGAATLRLDGAPTPVQKPSYSQGVDALKAAAARGAGPEEKAELALALVRDDLAHQRPIDGGSDASANQWRALLNDKPSASALANHLAPAELHELQRDHPEYFQALDGISGGVASQRLQGAVAEAYAHRANDLKALSDAGGSPEEKAKLAASLVRFDMRQGRPIDGGQPGHYQWRPLLNDQPSAAALTNRLSHAELQSLKDHQPEYFKALDQHAGGLATERLAEPPMGVKLTYV